MATGLYHITHLDNLPSMIESRALLSINELGNRKVGFTSVAYEAIQDQRSDTAVPCGEGGPLHDYIPFSFAPRSPMLCAISYGRVPSCPNQDEVVHLVSVAEEIEEAGLGFTFTDGHAIVAFSQFYDDLVS